MNSPLIARAGLLRPADCPIRLDQTIFAALHRCLHELSNSIPSPHASGARDRHRLRLSGRGPVHSVADVYTTKYRSNRYARRAAADLESPRLPQMSTCARATATAAGLEGRAIRLGHRYLRARSRARAGWFAQLKGSETQWSFPVWRVCVRNGFTFSRRCNDRAVVLAGSGAPVGRCDSVGLLPSPPGRLPVMARSSPGATPQALLETAMHTSRKRESRLSHQLADGMTMRPPILELREPAALGT